MYPDNMELNIQLPTWLKEHCLTYKESNDISARMSFVIETAQKNIDQQTGGPFAAGVFELDTGKLISLGVNLVNTQKLSILHAEIVALSLAQRAIDNFDLSKSKQRLELITSTEPCAMCLGAIPWSGIHRVITGATGLDAEAIGFDEGEKPNNWRSGLEKRGIDVITEVCRSQAKTVLKKYSDMNGQIYNSRGP